MDDLIAKALHAARHHLAEGGFLDKLFSGPDYLSTGEVASPTEWGNPDVASDFFKADKALRLAREIQAKADTEARRPPIPDRVVEEAPALPRATMRVAAEPSPSAKIMMLPDVGPYDFGQRIGGAQFREAPPHLTEQPGFGQTIAQGKKYADPTPEIVSRGLQNYTMPVSALTRPAKQAAIPGDIVALASEKIDSRAAPEADKIAARAPQGPELTDRDRDLIIRTIAAETSGKTPEESQAIAHVILNRIQSGKYGASPEAVLLAKKQFEPWSNPAGANYPMRFLPNSRRYGMGQAALEAALSGDDITGGALNFWGPKAQYALGRKAPGWAAEMPDYSDIGETRFHRPRAEGGGVDAALHMLRRHFDGSDGSFVDPMGNVAIPAAGPEEESQPVAVDNAERIRAAENAARLAKEIQSYEASMSGIRQQPQDIQSMTHAPEKPRAPISVEALGKNREFGSAPYDVAGPLSSFAQGAYDMKTLPLYMYPPTAPLGMAIDTAEGVASGSPTQVAMSAFGSPVKLAKSVIAPLAVATGVGAPDEAEAARLPRVGGVASALSKVGPKAADASLEQAMNVARQALQQPRELSPLGFYSHGAETAAALQQAKGTPEQYAAMLQKAGVKPAEMEGFGEAFAGRPSVTRDEIAAHFKEKMPQIEETVLGGKSHVEFTPEMQQRLNDLTDKRVSGGLTESEMAEKNQLYNLEQEARSGRSKTKFGQYSLPGGENYREVLLKYGETPEAKLERAKSYVRPDIWEAMTDAQRQQYLSAPDKGLFKSQHWDDPNVLAHLRMADRTGPNGEKILHVEEIQSDWGQKGKKEGFVTQYKPEDIKPMDPANITSERRRNEFWNFETPTGAIDVPRNDRWPTMEAARQHILDNVKPTGVPTAPYVTNTQAWTDLALKRALREAAEGGYDKLVWTPGAEQAKRYSLSNQVDRLQYIKNDDGTYAVIPYKNNRPLHQIERDNIPEKELESLFGRDVAEKMRAYEGDVDGNARSLSGQNLEVGGSGMKGYYDKIVPNQLSKLVKKLDPEAKVGRDAIQTQDTPRTMAYFLDWARARGDNRPRPTLGQVWQNGANEPLVQQFMKETSGLEVPSLTITPKMREAILGGQTAFAEGGSVVDRALEISRKG